MANWRCIGLEAWDREVAAARFAAAAPGPAGAPNPLPARLGLASLEEVVLGGSPVLGELPRPVAGGAAAAAGQGVATGPGPGPVTPSGTFPRHVLRMARLEAVADALAAAAIPSPPQPPLALSAGLAASRQARQGAQETTARLSPEPLGGPPMSQKRHATDMKGREGLGDLGIRRIENAVWRLWLKENRGGLPPPCGVAEEVGDSFVQKASEAIGRRFNFARGPELSKAEPSLEQKVREAFGPRFTAAADGGGVGESLRGLPRGEEEAGRGRFRSAASPVPREAFSSCTLPEPLGGPAVSQRRCCVDADGNLQCRDLGVRRMENATWRLWLKEHEQADKVAAADGLVRADIRKREEDDDTFVQKAQEAIGLQLDFVNIRRLRLKPGSFSPRDSSNACHLRPGHPEFLEQLEDACRIFKTLPASPAGYFSAAGTDDILAAGAKRVKGAKGAAQGPEPSPAGGLSSSRLMAASAAAGAAAPRGEAPQPPVSPAAATATLAIGALALAWGSRPWVC